MSQSLRLILMPDGSMERLCILSEKTPSNLKTSENGWREKYQSCVLWHKFSIHFRLTTNPMVWKSFLVHKLSIHLRLAANPMVRLTRSSQMSTIHIKPYTVSDGAPGKKVFHQQIPPVHFSAQLLYNIICYRNLSKHRYDPRSR